MYTIGKVAELTGMSIHTLRYYEKLGLVPPPKRNSGIRQYTDGDVQFLQFLYSLKQTGMSLEEIAEFASDGCILEEIKQRKEEVQKKQLERVIQLTEQKLEIYHDFLGEKHLEDDDEK
ncbi:MerR family transcriptional regulator [Bacillus sp. JJ864]|uniref:MerR family transcriptional regulator n=1 Tax=Bacillus sp. JJ864 TaxID=3122975 RepID=UPI002FFE0FBC